MYSQSSLDACAVSHAIVDVLKFRNTAVGAKIYVSAKTDDTFVYTFLIKCRTDFLFAAFSSSGNEITSSISNVNSTNDCFSSTSDSGEFLSNCTCTNLTVP